jgi:hypothetical protein
MSSSGVGERIEGWLAELDVFLDELPALTPDTDDVVAARKLRDVVDVVLSRVVERHARDGVWTGTGAKDYSAWFAAQTRAAQFEGQQRLNACELLELLPVLRAAVETGLVTAEHLQTMVRVITPKRRELAIRDEAVLVELASTLQLAEFRRLMAAWRSQADDALNDPTDLDEREEQRSLQLTQQTDQSWWLKGQLTAELGELLHTALAAALPKKTVADERSITQRRHDAMSDIIRLAMSTAERGTIGGEVPHLNIVHHLTDGTTRSASHWALRQLDLSMIMCDCKTTPICVTKDGVPLMIGTPETAIPMTNRRAVWARDGGCRFGGCGRPAMWSHIHHIQHRADGGTHELANLVMLCGFHHRYVHRHNVHLAWCAAGITLNATMPDGTTINGPPNHRVVPNLFGPS